MEHYKRFFLHILDDKPIFPHYKKCKRSKALKKKKKNFQNFKKSIIKTYSMFIVRAQ